MTAFAPLTVSVITVCLNSARTIAQTLRSVAEQSWPHIEHIVIDGASTDETLSVVAQHNSRVTHILSEPDKGIYDAMNKGIALAKGDVVSLLNSDDVYFDPNVVMHVVKRMQAERLDALLGDVAFFHDENPDRVIRRYNSGRFSPEKLAGGWMPAHPALFLRREIYERYGLYRTDYRIAGDFEFIARTFRGGTLRYQHLPQVLVKMRIGGKSTAGWRNTVLLNKEVLRACRENGIHTNLFKLLSKYPGKLLEFLQK